MDRILVSACLAGQPVRYDGKAQTLSHCLMTRWHAQGRLVAICPEMVGGLATPRRPSEIEPGATGEDVLDGRARVLDDHGADVTAAFLAGAQAAVALARSEDCRFALLMDRSPSCGVSQVYDGRFSGVLAPGQGVSAAALRRAGVQVFDTGDMVRLAAALT